jgi:hypothetical protein
MEASPGAIAFGRAGVKIAPGVAPTVDGIADSAVACKAQLAAPRADEWHRGTWGVCGMYTHGIEIFGFLNTDDLEVLRQ